MFRGKVNRHVPEQAMKSLTVKAKVHNLRKVLALINEELNSAGCSKKCIFQIDVAVEELFVNISCYAYAPDSGDVTVSITVDGDPAVAEITFLDAGVPFDPVSKSDPDVTLDAEKRAIGGLGIFMVKQSMDELLYERRDELNITTIRKKI